MSATLPEVLPDALASRLSQIAHVALDMDGTIYKGQTLFSCTKPFLAQLATAGIKYTFLTNNPSKSAKDYLSHLGRLGLQVTPEQLYTSAQAALDYLRIHRPHARRLFILGTSSMIASFAEAGYISTADDAGDEPDAVIVAFDTSLTYSRLGRAAWWINRGKFFIATNPDRICPTDQATILPDCAAICAALEVATGRKPDIVLGKPDPSMLAGILHRHGLAPHEVAMVGDRVYTDMLMAHRAGAFGVLVLSGEATRADAQSATPPPDLVTPDLAGFWEALARARENRSP